MTDYGHSISFGLSLYPSLDQVDTNVRLAQEADAVGLDYIAIQDHAYNPEFLDTWTLITHLAAETERITFVPDVLDLQLRPPTMVAKAAASLSVLSDGRIVLGVGGGASADGIAGMGGPRRTPAEMVSFTEEALGIMRRALRGGGLEFRGDQHIVEGYDAGPVPASPIPLWLGANGKRMLSVTGRSSDGWVSPLSVYVKPADVPARQQAIDEAAKAAGRTPTDVRRIYNVVGMIGPRAGGSGLVGDVGSWVDALSDWAVDLGFDTFIFWPNAAPHSQLATFAGEVMPAVRERVTGRRASRPPSGGPTVG